MRGTRIAGLAVFSLVFTGAALAQEAPQAEVTACPAELAEIATCYSAKHASGAYLLAAMPKTWNGGLAVFAHGGPQLTPMAATYSQPDLVKYSVWVKLGYAWVATSYRREGYGARAAAEDVDQARQFFIARLGKPQRTILHGASYGGLVSAKLLELYAKNADGSLNYDGALLNSGLLAGATRGYEFRVDLRVVYQYYCKNLPRPDEAQYPLWMGLPADSKLTLKGLETRVDECTGILKPAAERSEQQKQNLANITKVIGIPAPLLFRHMQTATLLFRNVVQTTTGGRNPFSNEGMQYKGSSDDEALNRGVERFAADPAGYALLKADGEPNGTLPLPMVSLHSINDPQVAVESQSVYRDAVTAAGNGGRLVQAYTDEPLHTGQSAAELAAAIGALTDWIAKGTKPTPQSIAARCQDASTALAGPCRYHPEFVPNAYSTRYYPRQTASR
jgi:hypothetical protein